MELQSSSSYICIIVYIFVPISIPVLLNVTVDASFDFLVLADFIASNITNGNGQ